MNDASKRDDWIDALRAIALFGVFLINVVGYPDLLNHGAPAGAPKPLDSNAALTLHALTLGLVANKAYPLLCFLFGFSAQTMLGHSNETSHLRARYWKLLLLGAAHELLLYAGDTLALYAALGLIASRWKDPLSRWLGGTSTKTKPSRSTI